MASAGWARFAHRFGQYYRDSTFWRPPRMPKREWMFIPFGGSPPLRHKSFRNEQELRRFLSERAMHSCFYSTAYWQKPYEMKMDNKMILARKIISHLALNQYCSLLHHFQMIVQMTHFQFYERKQSDYLIFHHILILLLLLITLIQGFIE